jgi:serine/threonine protein phosphatase PrpC
VSVAVSGDRGCRLSRQLGPHSYLFAVATGFGRIGGEPAAPLALGKMRSEFERRARSGRWERLCGRPHAAAALLGAVVGRVNEELHSRSASHEDYVTAGASITAVLLLRERAYLAHIGSTAAYLARGGSLVTLTKNDTFEGDRAPVLIGALGLTHTLDVAISTFALAAGDALVLAERALPADGERLVVTFGGVEETQGPAPVEAHTAQSILTGVLATVLFYAMLALR